jgi:hypothetical protein
LVRLFSACIVEAQMHPRGFMQARMVDLAPQAVVKNVSATAMERGNTRWPDAAL